MTIRRSTRATRRWSVPPMVWLIAPSVVFMAALFAWPTVTGVLQAFQSDHGFTLDYLRRMTADPRFWPAVRNTLLLIVVLIPLQFVAALAMALLLQAKPRGSGFHFYVWAVPLAVSDLAAGLVWLSIFADHGYLNSLLERLGIGAYSWLSYEHPGTMLAAVVVAEMWRSTSLVLVIVIAGLQGIPRDYDEAAQVFGATYWQRLRQVILPLLRPSLQVALILRTILAFQTFAVAQALTGHNFPILVGETYYWYSQLQNEHVASALAIVVLGVSMVTAVVYLRVLRERSARGSVR